MSHPLNSSVWEWILEPEIATTVTFLSVLGSFNLRPESEVLPFENADNYFLRMPYLQ